ncbi:MerR family transcriptional regulator [Gordonia aichiensis]|uniref:MerR family transcriptional regulator n=1 Tax=Gordonia aichiensis TaxID=36820 RepID=UPI0032645B0B
MQGSFDEMAPELFELNAADNDAAGYRSPVVAQLAGVTYRQLDYWARTGLVVPTARAAAGSGSQRLYAFKDILVLKVVKNLLEAGISLQNIRVAVEHLRSRGVHDLASTTLFSDGVTVYECTRDDEVLDLLRGGQGVFGIAVGPAMLDLAGQLREMPAEVAVRDEAPRVDELAARRSKKAG